MPLKKYHMRVHSMSVTQKIIMRKVTIQYIQLLRQIPVASAYEYFMWTGKSEVFTCVSILYFFATIFRFLSPNEDLGSKLEKYIYFFFFLFFLFTCVRFDFVTILRLSGAPLPQTSLWIAVMDLGDTDIDLYKICCKIFGILSFHFRSWKEDDAEQLLIPRKSWHQLSGNII